MIRDSIFFAAVLTLAAVALLASARAGQAAMRWALYNAMTARW